MLCSRRLCSWGTLAFVIGDNQAVRQILTNLVDNAVKFTSAGTVRLSAVATERGEAGMEYRFTVADTGLGIDPTDHHRIFQHMTQLDSTETRIAGGLGLGLSICQWLCDMMGGQIVVESQVGVGSTFTLIVTLPLAAVYPRKIAA